MIVIERKIPALIWILFIFTIFILFYNDSLIENELFLQEIFILTLFVMY